ncbi:MAG: SET domain-containing protein-lysine N-methyltransferase [Candidatus Woesearchaeota archaeon]|nr:SET domain-containing protein-lysine N-methyltransferase [Candidatus Woesearchaeota archaeon]
MVDLLIKKKSHIHGIGIFTTKNIKNKSIFYEVPMKLLSDKAISKLAYIGKCRWVSDEKVLNYVNHSCEPNSVLDISDQPKLVAKRDINADEEITVDYNKTEKKGKKVPCNCNTKTCKKYFLRIE